ncbi:hypothetical protein NMR30_003655 [Vibrio cholerae]|nr:hypothetical protein [Vibrio cholerae]EKF9373102.1 hypothetical protein [Vibrio cholerae]
MNDLYAKEFEIRKQSPLWWHNKASDLFASAGALHSTMDADQDVAKDLGFPSGFCMSVACNPVYEMLFGMSFEALLKAICVAKKKPAPASHNLNNLANTAEVKLSETEVEIFKYLTESVVWSGRYPVPKQKEYLEQHWKQGSDLRFDKVLSSGVLQFKVANDVLGWGNLSNIWRKLSKEFFEHYT